MRFNIKNVATAIAATALAGTLAIVMTGCGKTDEGNINQGSPENTNTVTNITTQKETKSFDASKYIGDDGVIRVSAYIDLDGDQLAELFEKAGYTEENETLAQWELMQDNKITYVSFASENDPTESEEPNWVTSSAERVKGQPSLGNRPEMCEYFVNVIEHLEGVKSDPNLNIKWWAQTDPDQIGFRSFAAGLIDPDGNEILLTGADDGGTEVYLCNAAALDGETLFYDEITATSIDEFADKLAGITSYGRAWHVEKF